MQTPQASPPMMVTSVSCLAQGMHHFLLMTVDLKFETIFDQISENQPPCHISHPKYLQLK